MDNRLFFYHYSIGVDDYIHAHYALYAPILNRFILLTTDLEAARTLTWLLISKIYAVPVRLDKSENFTTELIDNSVCTHWGLADIDPIHLKSTFLDAFNLYTHKTTVVDCNNELSTNNELLLEVQKFAFLGHYVKQFFKHSCDGVYAFGYDVISALVEDPVLIAIKNKERQCYKIICTVTDYTCAESEVLAILDQLRMWQGNQ
jgi:hypothetical protein